MGVVNIPGQNLTWQMRSRPNGLYSVQNKGKPMQLRRKMKKKAQMMMVPDTASESLRAPDNWTIGSNQLSIVTN